nr:hypothetical protein [uncultured Peptostreptococcus sp.]
MHIIFSRNLVEMVMFFFIYSFLGWVVEVAFHALKCGKFINRGMLAGAVCPIYGFGAVIIIYLLEPIKDNLLLLFLGSAILCTVLEYLAGLALDKLFHKRWWDYSDVPYNIGGYVCLQFSVYWGIGGIILVRDIQELIGDFVNIFSTEVLFFVNIVFIIMMLVDAIATVSSINKMNRKLELLDELQGQIHKMSDFIGENVSEKTLEIADKSQPVIENLESKRTEMKTKAMEAKKEREENAAKIRESISKKISDREIAMESKAAERMNKLSKSIYGNNKFINKDKYTIEELKKKKLYLHDNPVRGEKRLLKAFPNIKENKRKKEFNEMHEKFLDKKKGA